MKESIKNKWVKALRSGKYKQTKNYLRTNHGFCCLGVLCDISKTHRWKKVEFEEGLSYGGASEDLPPRVKEWAGMKDSNGAIPYGCVSLASLNDDGINTDPEGSLWPKFETLNFDEIADVIEMTWEDL